MKTLLITLLIFCVALPVFGNGPNNPFKRGPFDKLRRGLTHCKRALNTLNTDEAKTIIGVTAITGAILLLSFVVAYHVFPEKPQQDNVFDIDEEEEDAFQDKEHPFWEVRP